MRLSKVSVVWRSVPSVPNSVSAHLPPLSFHTRWPLEHLEPLGRLRSYRLLPCSSSSLTAGQRHPPPPHDNRQHRDHAPKDGTCGGLSECGRLHWAATGHCGQISSSSDNAHQTTCQSLLLCWLDKHFQFLRLFSLLSDASPQLFILSVHSPSKH